MDNTIEYVISPIIADLKEINNDSRLSKRCVYNTFNLNLKFLLKQEFEKKRLEKLSDIWKTICVPTENVDKNLCSCYNLPINCNIVRTKIKIPRIVGSSYGDIIHSVTNVFGSVEFEQTTSSNYNTQKNIKYNSTKYYFQDDNYFYFPNSDVKLIKIKAYFEDNVDEFICDKINDEKQICKSKLKEVINAPEYLISTAVKMTKEELLKTYKNIREDTLINKNSIPNT